MCLCSCCVQSNRMMIVFAVKACVKAACVHVGRLHGLSESFCCACAAWLNVAVRMSAVLSPLHSTPTLSTQVKAKHSSRGPCPACPSRCLVSWLHCFAAVASQSKLKPNDSPSSLNLNTRFFSSLPN
ncbi:hypothetical protein I3843_Q021100 [Carya illinoinensis]|nr:hypothetical protein I3843_Q021100 [Carya illinoinensis]